MALSRGREQTAAGWLLRKLAAASSRSLSGSLALPAGSVHGPCLPPARSPLAACARPAPPPPRPPARASAGHVARPSPWQRANSSPRLPRRWASRPAAPGRHRAGLHLARKIPGHRAAPLARSPCLKTSSSSNRFLSRPGLSTAAVYTKEGFWRRAAGDPLTPSIPSSQARKMKLGRGSENPRKHSRPAVRKGIQWKERVKIPTFLSPSQQQEKSLKNSDISFKSVSLPSNQWPLH